MSANRRTVERYLAAFEQPDPAPVLACLADDVEWVLPGAFHLRGKDAFAREIRNENFIGDPQITVTRIVEDGDVVVAEGTVRTQRRDGAWLQLAYCDVFELRGGLIRKLTSYLMETR